jgi:hypothetical protein
MSHFATIAILPQNYEDTFGLEMSLEILLDRFDENKNVPQYDRECWCINRIANRAAEAAADEQFGTWATRKLLFNENADYQAMLRAADTDATIDTWDTGNAMWREYNKDWSAEREAFVKNFEENHPDYNKPSPDCEECHGTGTYKSHYNPESKWDWWVIGGRWGGALYDENSESESEDHEDNMILIQEMLDRPRENIFFPRAIITPDGKWHQKGRMGWFGMSSDDKEQNKWEDEVMALYEQYPNNMMVLLDLHI